MKTWDYIVIGAGSAGCVVARRLSDDPSVSVLLLEAGPPPDSFWIGVPAGMARVIGHPAFDWCYTTEPNSGLNGRTVPFARGRTLGGSSAINGLVYTRGNRRDYDHWASLGNPGWSWDDVLPLFRRLEDNSRGASDLRGAGGPQKVSDSRLRSAAVGAFVAAAERCGVPRVEDLSVAGEEGVGHMQATSRHGKRCSAYDGYLRPVRHRSNLTIVPGCQVQRILVEDGAATGVSVLQAGGPSEYRCRREVVLSAGAANSPQLLMLSGIGDGTQLQAHGLETLVHLPGVGRNLQDHCAVHLKFAVQPGISGNGRVNGWRKYVEGARWLFTRTGYLAESSTLAAAFVRSGPEVDYADLEIGFRPISFFYSPVRGAQIDPFPAVSASVYRVRPASRGQVRLRSSDPAAPPVIDTDYMGQSEDVMATVAGVRKIREIMSSDPIAAKIQAELYPGPAVGTEDQLIDFVRANAKCSYHITGTCRMGTDDGAVVDARLRVKGVRGLRVIDASVMPSSPSGNTNAATLMVGEKGAGMLMADRRDG